jgi:hypothetical protein
VPADTASDDATKAVINDIIACLGADTDASGKPGVSQAKVNQFFADAAGYSDWWPARASWRRKSVAAQNRRQSGARRGRRRVARRTP